jgi:hypothetical protein
VLEIIAIELAVILCFISGLNKNQGVQNFGCVLGFLFVIWALYQAAQVSAGLLP